MTFKITTNIKKLMLKHGNMSVSDLSAATGLPQPTLHQIYTGTTKRPRKKTLCILADFFSVTVKQLFGEEELPFRLPDKTKKQLGINTIPILSWGDLFHWPDEINYLDRGEIFGSLAHL
jgi:transcriptional regulator with XRE-family HTH domain